MSDRLEVVLADGYHLTGRKADPHGICVHDTGSPANTNRANMVRMLTQGLTQAGGKRLPPPIYTYIIWPDGGVTQIAAERVKTNHAGRVMRSRLSLLYRSLPAAGRATSAGVANGNAATIGVAMCRMGAKVPAHAQYVSLVRLCAEICARWAWRPWSAVVGHSELTKRKIDPQRVDLNLLRRDVAAQMKSGSFPNRPAEPPPFTTLKRGCKSESVGKVHDRLVQLGFMRNPGRHRGTFGPKTEAAVKSFQRAHGLKADGLVGVLTWSKLAGSDVVPKREPVTASKPAAKPPKPPVAPPKPTVTLELSDAEKDVLKAVLRRLDK